ncbi:MAG TPA: hypothetical protein VMY42_26285 [Thermoguttaceae bacterium]|nr:hypothetical protein [Thermoguttaceae bacterium]
MTRNRFRIEDSFPIEAKKAFVFAGDVIDGTVAPGMSFDVPEAGHRWTLRVVSVERISKSDGSVCVGLVVNDRSPGYLRGMGSGWTAELTLNDETKNENPTMCSAGGPVDFPE